MKMRGVPRLVIDLARGSRSAVLSAREDKRYPLILSSDIRVSFNNQTSTTMAFDHPVDADRVELNFGSIMARAPVIGSLMYLLGGHHAREEDEHAREEGILDDTRTTESQCSLSGSQRNIKSALKKSSPSLAPTDRDSDTESFQSALDSDRHNETFGSEASFRRKKKELSWSDESGQNLVQYMDACTVSFHLVSTSLSSFRTRTQNIQASIARPRSFGFLDVNATRKARLPIPHMFIVFPFLSTMARAVLSFLYVVCPSIVHRRVTKRVGST